jgi:hypothetical protein
LLRNDSKSGSIKYTDLTSKWAPDLLKPGLACDAVWTDVNNDGWSDLVVAGEFMPIQIYQNEKGHLVKLEKTGLEEITGLWGSVAAADFDQDGDVDLVAGNMGKNTLLRANAKQPVDVLHGDVDGNGVYDIFPFVYFQSAAGTPVSAPLFGKDDVHKQLNSTRQRWVYYKDYGKITQDDFLTEKEKAKASKLSFTENASMYMENLGGGHFKAKALPDMAQLSSLNGMQILDVNSDGYLDILYVGNNFANEVAMGRYDASNGGVLLGNGKGFTYAQNSGMMVSADAKSLVGIQVGSELAFIAFQNRGPMRVFKPQQGVFVKANVKLGQAFSYTFKGHKQKVDWNYGSSYLSQSASAQTFIPKGAKLN